MENERKYFPSRTPLDAKALPLLKVSDMRFNWITTQEYENGLEVSL